MSPARTLAYYRERRRRHLAAGSCVTCGAEAQVRDGRRMNRCFCCLKKQAEAWHARKARYCNSPGITRSKTFCKACDRPKRSKT